MLDPLPLPPPIGANGNAFVGGIGVNEPKLERAAVFVFETVEKDFALKDGDLQASFVVLESLNAALNDIFKI